MASKLKVRMYTAQEQEVATQLQPILVATMGPVCRTHSLFGSGQRLSTQPAWVSMAGIKHTSWRCCCRCRCCCPLQAILHGVNGSLQANLSSTTPAKTAPPAAATKPLPTSTAAKPSKMAVASERQPKVNSGHRHLLNLMARGGRGGGGRGYSGDSGYNQMAANTAAASNTAYAIDAAASGHIPASAATTYGSYQAQAAAADNYCYNCRGWY